MLDQVTVQSFDWGALMRMREVEPALPIVALTNGQQFLQVGQPGASPWLGGIDIDDFAGSLVDAAASFDADAVSPVHGDPQNGKVGDPGYVPFTTPRSWPRPMPPAWTSSSGPWTTWRQWSPSSTPRSMASSPTTRTGCAR